MEDISKTRRAEERREKRGERREERRWAGKRGEEGGIYFYVSVDICNILCHAPWTRRLLYGMRGRIRRSKHLLAIHTKFLGLDSLVTGM